MRNARSACDPWLDQRSHEDGGADRTRAFVEEGSSDHLEEIEYQKKAGVSTIIGYNI